LSLLVGDLAERCFTTRTARNNIGRPGAVRRIGILLMARLFTAMLSAIKQSATLVGAFEESGPMLNCHRAVRCDVRLAALEIVTTVAAQNILLHVPAVAARGYTHLASAT
jgi:hypothetical protein